MTYQELKTDLGFHLSDILNVPHRQLHDKLMSLGNPRVLVTHAGYARIDFPVDEGVARIVTRVDHVDGDQTFLECRISLSPVAKEKM